jgi:hypothetical protein
VPVIEHPGEAWDGETGRVTDAVARRTRILRGYDAYLCGPRCLRADGHDLTGTGQRAQDLAEWGGDPPRHAANVGE